MPDALAVTRALIAEATPDMLRNVLLRLLDSTAPAPRANVSLRHDTRTTPRTVPTPRTRPKREAKAPTPRARPRREAKARTPPTPRKAKAAPTPRRKHTANELNAEWEALRAQVRATMIERDTGFDDLASALGRMPASVKAAVCTTKPAGADLQAELRDWLDRSAPEVAAPAPPFRGTDSRGRANGSTTAA